MNDVVINANGLGKAYTIGHNNERPESTLRDQLARSASRFKRNLGDIARGRPIYAGDEMETFWALRDVDFEIKQGEVLGVIGRNGAGKSTLLKVLSRITDPTEGRVTLSGRVASLLEVGTGFHPELSGRENVFLNGAILGMTRAEIKARFEEIVDFAGVEKFLDTPVKRYSSGMYVRLAFSVAAHLEPEILIIDEVLAVGDTEFQQKCLGKMESVANSGRTILFVSHNLASVEQLCTRCLFLKNGSVEATGPVGEVLEQYREGFSQAQVYGLESGAPSKIGPQIKSFHWVCNGVENGAIVPNEEVVFDVAVTERHENQRLILKIQTLSKTVVFGFNSKLVDGLRQAKGNTYRLRIPKIALSPGTYDVALVLLEEKTKLHAVNPAATVEVVDAFVDGLQRTKRNANSPVSFAEHEWSVVS